MIPLNPEFCIDQIALLVDDDGIVDDAIIFIGNVIGAVRVGGSCGQMTVFAEFKGLDGDTGCRVSER